MFLAIVQELCRPWRKEDNSKISNVGQVLCKYVKIVSKSHELEYSTLTWRQLYTMTLMLFELNLNDYSTMETISTITSRECEQRVLHDDSANSGQQEVSCLRSFG